MFTEIRLEWIPGTRKFDGPIRIIKDTIESHYEEVTNFDVFLNCISLYQWIDIQDPDTDTLLNNLYFSRLAFNVLGDIKGNGVSEQTRMNGVRDLIDEIYDFENE